MKEYRNSQNPAGEHVECIDLDRYLLIVMEEFNDTRKRNLQDLKKKFSERFESEKGYFSCEDFKEIISPFFDHTFEIDG